jgi:transposase InsO family protein
MQNGYIESFNGKFRDKCLNEQWFQSLSQARDCIAEWRKDYNEVSESGPTAVLGGFLPHSSPISRGFKSLPLIPTTINF